MRTNPTNQSFGNTMEKVVNISTLKPMVLIIKTKLKTKIERKVKELTQHNQKVWFKSTPEDIREMAEYYYEDERSFVDDLELCCRNTGDVILNATELMTLYKYYEEELP